MVSFKYIFLFLVVVAVGTVVFGMFALAWTNPTQNPPNANVSAPVNVGSTAQTKSGNLFSSATLGGATVNATSTLCISGDCKSAWSQVGQSQWTTQGSDIYYNTGSASIGTTATSSQLHVFNSTGDNLLKLSRGASTSTLLRVGTDGALVVQNQSSDVLTIKSGNVGIGTTGPNARLSIGNNVATGFLDTYSEYQVILYDGGTAASSYGLGIEGGTMVFNTNGAYSFDRTGSATSMVIDSGGNVGIGTTGPNQKLDVAGNIRINQQIFSPASYVGFLTDASGALPIKAYSLALTSSYANNAPAGGLYVEGNVGIGTTNPGNLLTIQQTSATDPIADAWTTYSSRRWKTNIMPIGDALDKVLKLQGVTFDWKADGKHDLGLIAEDVGAVVPEVVAYEANGVDAKSVDYARLTAVLIQAVKEQQKEIEELKAENVDLRRRITALER